MQAEQGHGRVYLAGSGGQLAGSLSSWSSGKSGPHELPVPWASALTLGWSHGLQCGAWEPLSITSSQGYRTDLQSSLGLPYSSL